VTSVAFSPPSGTMTAVDVSAQTPSAVKLDEESAAWIAALRSDGHRRDEATARLYELLLAAARFEVGRRRRLMSHLRGNDFDDIAHQCAGDALVAILGKLDDFRGDSRFTTWAYKFALLEAAVKLRRRGWQGRELPLEPEQWSAIADSGSSPSEGAETNALLEEIEDAIKTDLSPHQREVLVAIAVNGVPIDVMAERLNTTRGALYKTVHDARKKLRASLDSAGMDLEFQAEGGDRE
jgi:RNA polymerase sigma-70 factor, ECF subfamily